MSDKTTIVTNTSTLSRVADAIVAQSEGALSKGKVLNILASEISGPKHNWGFLKNHEGPVFDRNSTIDDVQAKPAGDDETTAFETQLRDLAKPAFYTLLHEDEETMEIVGNLRLDIEDETILIDRATTDFMKNSRLSLSTIKIMMEEFGTDYIDDFVRAENAPILRKAARTFREEQSALPEDDEALRIIDTIHKAFDSLIDDDREIRELLRRAKIDEKGKQAILTQATKNFIDSFDEKMDTLRRVIRRDGTDYLTDIVREDAEDILYSIAHDAAKSTTPESRPIKVVSHIPLDMVIGGYDYGATISLWVDAQNGKAHLRAHTDLGAFDGPDPKPGSMEFEVTGKSGWIAIFEEGEVEPVRAELESILKNWTAGTEKNLEDKVYGALHELTLDQETYEDWLRENEPETADELYGVQDDEDDDEDND